MLIRPRCHALVLTPYAALGQAQLPLPTSGLLGLRIGALVLSAWWLPLRDAQRLGELQLACVESRRSLTGMCSFGVHPTSLQPVWCTSLAGTKGTIGIHVRQRDARQLLHALAQVGEILGHCPASCEATPLWSCCCTAWRLAAAAGREHCLRGDADP